MVTFGQNVLKDSDDSKHLFQEQYAKKFHLPSEELDTFE